MERGGSVDLTASTTTSLVAAGDIPAAEALARLLQDGLPASRITMSSDGHASLPHFDASGELISIEVAPLSSLRDRGQVRVGAAADLLFLDPGTLAVSMTFACGRHHLF